MSITEQEIIERVQLYQTAPEELWEWLLDIDDRDTPSNVREWFRKTAIYARDELFPSIKKANENLVGLYPVHVMWGYQSQLGSGISNSRIYNYYFGTFGTGHMLLTDRTCYITVTPELTEKCPLYKKSFISSVLMGILGERDRTEPTLEGRSWKIPIQAMKTAKITTDAQRQECVELITDMANLLVYPVHEPMVIALQMTISGKLTQVFRQQQGLDFGDGSW